MSRAPAARETARRIRGLLAAGAVLLCLGGLGGASYGLALVREVTAGLPAVPDVAALPVSTVVLDRNGELLRPFTTSDGRWRLPVTPDEVDPRLVRMLLAYEDGRFREHGGVDWQALLRAAGQYVVAGGRIVSGGSTLTMQVARLLEQRSTRSLAAKLRQIAFAQVLEGALSKDEILTLYFTLAPYGGNIEGIRAASLAYFGKEPTRLSAAEAALLVALPQSPEARRPDRDPEAARAARGMVLQRMVSAGMLSAEEAALADRDPVPTARRPFPVLAAHLAREAVAQQPGERQVALTVERRLQAALEDLAASRAERLGSKISVAIVVADHASGEVRASVGSAGLFATESAGFLDMTQAVRSPGSTLKPLIYGLAFELGLAHPESLIEDRPTGFGSYVPVNFDGFSRGTVSMRQALVESLNVPAVVVLDALGASRLAARMRRAGAEPMLPENSAPSLAIGLGGVGVTLRDLVSIYAAIARGGAPVTLVSGASEFNADRFVPAPVLDPMAAWYVTDILADVPPPLNGSPGQIAYKTGTSYGYRDAWSIGYDGKTVIGVWVGRPDNAPVPGLSGIATAAPILFEAFNRVGGARAPLPAAPAGALLASNSQLPEPLRHFRHPSAEMAERQRAPQIAYPADGVDVDLGLAQGGQSALVVKVRDGVPPFTFLANGSPFTRSNFARQASWTPDGPGFVTLAVVDARGRSAAVKVFVE